MMAFVLAAAVLLGALCVAAALDGAALAAPPGAVAPHVLASELLAALSHIGPVALSNRRREPVPLKAVPRAVGDEEHRKSMVARRTAVRCAT
jgi:hypothetical protein